MSEILDSNYDFGGFNKKDIPSTLTDQLVTLVNQRDVTPVLLGPMENIQEVANLVEAELDEYLLIRLQLGDGDDFKSFYGMLSSRALEVVDPNINTDRTEMLNDLGNLDNLLKRIDAACQDKDKKGVAVILENYDYLEGNQLGELLSFLRSITQPGTDDKYDNLRFLLTGQRSVGNFQDSNRGTLTNFEEVAYPGYVEEEFDQSEPKKGIKSKLANLFKK